MTERGVAVCLGVATALVVAACTAACAKSSSVEPDATPGLAQSNDSGNQESCEPPPPGCVYANGDTCEITVCQGLSGSSGSSSLAEDASNSDADGSDVSLDSPGESGSDATLDAPEESAHH